MYVVVKHLPPADFSERVTVTIMGLLDTPPVSFTVTSITSDNSEPMNCLDVNSISNASTQTTGYI